MIGLLKIPHFFNGSTSMRTTALVAPGLAALLISGCATSSALVLKDPAGDDNGPGSYIYPTDPVYTEGSFDILDLQVKTVGENVEFRVTVNATIEDPWNSMDWPGGGNGFSVQMAQVYIDQDHAEGSGFTETLPGIYATFAPQEAWDKVVMISPQPRSRIGQEIDLKAQALKDAVVIPSRTSALGRTLIATVPVAELGGAPQPGWGYQVVMQSNEGFPDGAEVLSRKVNEYEGTHRFGGGTDYNCDPHVMDILVSPASGGAAEADAQHAALGSYVCGEDPTDASSNTLAVLPMVYPGAN